MRFLLVDKGQRVKIKNKYPYTVKRLTEELENMSIPYDFAYNNELAMSYHNGKLKITIKKKDILDYTHIMFRGHYLEKHRSYQMKRMVINHIDHHNKKSPNNQIKVHNAEAMKVLPYYNKITTMQLCAYNDIPYFNSYYRLDGDYKNRTDKINYPYIIKEYAGINDIRKIKEKRKVKKNVYLVKKEKDLQQEHLKDKDITHFYIQEFSTVGQDIRTFVKGGKVVGGFKRTATESFKTVLHGKYEMYNKPSEQIKKLAEKMGKILKADFVAVDFMVKKDGNPYLQEISFHPGFKAYETKIKDGKPINVPKLMIESLGITK